jgi:hypothetical protein
LACSDATTGGVAPAASLGETVEGLTFEGDGHVGYRPADVGVHVPGKPDLYFAKLPANVRAGSSAVMVELPTGSNGYLAWVPARIWTGGGGRTIDLTRWMASRVVFHGCPEDAGTFLGGVLSTEPHICLTLRVSQSSVKGRPREVDLCGEGHC